MVESQRNKKITNRLIIEIGSLNTHIIVVESSVTGEVARPVKSIHDLDMATKIELRKIINGKGKFDHTPHT